MPCVKQHSSLLFLATAASWECLQACRGCKRAGLGDVVVPGLLACLALRFDASRATDMRARAAAAAEALQRAVGALGVRISNVPSLAHVLCGGAQGMLWVVSLIRTSCMRLWGCL